MADFKEQVQNLREFAEHKGWKIQSRDRDGRQYVMVIWQEADNLYAHSVDPKQVRDLTRKIFPRAELSSYGAHTSASLRINPEDRDHD